jgi:hypothetical protein
MGSEVGEKDITTVAPFTSFYKYISEFDIL